MCSAKRDYMYNILTEAKKTACYIKKHHRLPSFYMTKQAATCLGWKGGSLDAILPGKAIGGDVFRNDQGILPKGKYRECDLGTLGKRGRGACRLVFSNNSFFLTLDHYHTFTKITV